MQAFDQAISGTLLLQTKERHKHAILFDAGIPAKARLAQPAVSFASLAQAQGLISADLVAPTQERAQQLAKTEGRLLLEEKRIDETAYYLLLRQQLHDQVLWLCDLPASSGFGLYTTNYLEEYGDPGHYRVEPLPLIWRSCSAHLPVERRAGWLQKLGQRPLRLRGESPVSRYGLRKDERAAFDLLRARPSTLAQLAASGVGSPEQVRQLVCAMLLTRQLDLGVAQAPPVGLSETTDSASAPARASVTSNANVPAPSAVSRLSAPRQVRVTEPPASARGAPKDPVSTASSTAPVGVLPSVTPPSPRRSLTPTGVVSPSSKRAFRLEIEQFQARNPQNHYDVLGVERSATAATIRGAFFQLAKRWHPDRLPPALSDLKPFVTQAFVRMGEAHQTLVDDKRRAEYDSALREVPEEEQAQVAAILQAASAFQRAEILTKKRDFAGALVEAQAAYEGDPTQADHTALFAWLQGTQRSEDFGELIQLLDDALEKDSENIRAFWYRAQLCKKAGQTQKAMRDFKKIIQLKPNHVEAQRELRVYSMRKRSDPHVNPKTSSLWGRLMKKD